MDLSLLRLHGTRAVHQLLDLTLLLGQPVDVRLEVVEAVVHGVKILRVSVDVHGLNVGSSRLR